MHPPQVTTWKKQALEGIPEIFSTRRSLDLRSVEEEKSRLYEEIGRLKVELDWLKKKLDCSSSQKRHWVEPDHPDLGVVGTEVSEQLGCKPLEFYVIEHVRYKIARRSNTRQGVKIAPAPEKPIVKGMADATLRSSVVTDKFLYHQPRNRHEKRFERFGLPLTHSTLYDWVLEVADLLRPLHI